MCRYKLDKISLSNKFCSALKLQTDCIPNCVCMYAFFMFSSTSDLQETIRMNQRLF